MKKYTVGGSILVSFLALSYFFILKPIYLNEKKFIDIQYIGRINKIELREGYRGSPHVQIGNTWYLFSINESNVKNYIQVGDSILKRNGSDKIIIYRKNNNGQLEERIFDQWKTLSK